MNEMIVCLYIDKEIFDGIDNGILFNKRINTRQFD